MTANSNATVFPAMVTFVLHYSPAVFSDYCFGKYHNTLLVRLISYLFVADIFIVGLTVITLSSSGPLGTHFRAQFTDVGETLELGRKRFHEYGLKGFFLVH